MKLLLDEDVPIQLVEPLRHLLRDHVVDHVENVGWKGKKDQFLLRDAGRSGYDAFLTNDSGQLDDPAESAAIKKSGMHHIRYQQNTKLGVDGLALAMGSVIAGIRQVITELGAADGQRLVLIKGISSSKRHTTIDPTRDPPRYWPGRRGRRSQ